MNPEALFKITYGLYVVGAGREGKGNGYTSNTVFQITATPQQFAVASSKDNFTTGLIKECGYFTFSVLQKDARPEIIGTFGYKSGRDTDKYMGLKYKTGKSGAPILLEDCIAWFECELVQTYDTGTHILFIGRVIDYDLTDDSKEPLTYQYYRDVKKGKAPKNAPTYINTEKTVIMEKEKTEYTCPACGYVYKPEEGDPDGGIKPETEFEDLPDDWHCPLCGMEKNEFIKTEK